MNLEQGVIWGYRLLLNREPDNAELIAASLPHCQSPEDIRNFFMNSAEYHQKFEYAGRAPETPRFPVDLREGILWGYRLLFRREPSEEHVQIQLARTSTIRNVREIFLLSPEFERQKGYGAPDLQTLEILSRFAPFHDAPAEPGFFADFLGTRTRVSYLPHFYQHKSGTVEGGPNTAARGIHGTAEWIGTLRSVTEARDTFVAVELGAGWAPWLVSSAFAARKIGISDIRLVGVEASPEHVAFMRQHFLDNGLDPDAHKIVYAVAGAADGVARFPKLIDPSDHYGAHAAFDPQDAVAAPGFGEWEEIPSVSIKTLLADIELVDILHCDIQGAEDSVMTAAIDLLNDRVRRIVVGTHSRQIEGDLFDLFGGNGWHLEFEQPCVIDQQDNGSFHVLVDGEQVWRNPRSY